MGIALRRILVGLVAGGVALAALAAPTAAAPTAPAATSHLYLVTLSGPGTAGYRGDLTRVGFAAHQRLRQDSLLATVGSPAPVYRWTTALDGFAVRLTDAQARTLASRAAVVSVERNAVRRVADLAQRRVGLATGALGPGHGGAGEVIGMVDTGLWPDNPLFADVPGLGRTSPDFRGTCQTGEGWPAATCNRKVVGARWFVAGYGADRVRTSSSLSPRDDDGHGTLGASVAAGNAGVSVHVPGQPGRIYSGAAPRAALAIYKACWAAPDPRQDGCATADLVTAIDRATRDRVDVLNLAVGGPSQFDTVERALLGAAESGVVVVAAAGNHGTRQYAAHPSPWVLTLGATTGTLPRGTASLSGGGPSYAGAMAGHRGVGPARVVLGADIAALGTPRAAARLCRPGSLDAGRARGAVVVCARGAIGRVDKSAAVRQADGVGMVLLNRGPGTIDADFHSVPTVHLSVREARPFLSWVRRHPGERVRLTPAGEFARQTRVTAWSSGGDPAGAVLKPDLVDTGAGVLGAVPPGERGLRWGLETGTSAATAHTSGVAARLLTTPGWTAPQVRSALVTTAANVLGEPLREGAGRVAVRGDRRPDLAYLVRPGAYRHWLDGSLPAESLNVPSILADDRVSVVSRRITNVSGRRLYFSSSARGFTRHQVVVTPAAVRLGPGQSAVFHVRMYGASPTPVDRGEVVWRSADGSETRIPVVLTR